MTIPLPPRPPRRRSETREVVRPILDALAGLPGVVAWRNNTGSGYAASGGRITFGLGLGGADVIACVSGRFVALEAKSRKGRQRPEQREWAAAVRAAGGIYAIVRDVDAALAVVRQVQASAEAAARLTRQGARSGEVEYREVAPTAHVEATESKKGKRHER